MGDITHRGEGFSSLPASPSVPACREANGADRLHALEVVAELANELVNGGGLVNRGVDRGLVVVEKSDRSDPHYRLCGALDILAALSAPADAGEAVERDEIDVILEDADRLARRMGARLIPDPEKVAAVRAAKNAAASDTLGGTEPQSGGVHKNPTPKEPDQ